MYYFSLSTALSIVSVQAEFNNQPDYGKYEFAETSLQPLQEKTNLHTGFNQKTRFHAGLYQDNILHLQKHKT